MEKITLHNILQFLSGGTYMMVLNIYNCTCGHIYIYNSLYQIIIAIAADSRQVLKVVLCRDCSRVLLLLYVKDSQWYTII